MSNLFNHQPQLVLRFVLHCVLSKIIRLKFYQNHTKNLKQKRKKKPVRTLVFMFTNWWIVGGNNIFFDG